MASTLSPPTVAVLNQKGGVGKTTLTLLLAWVLTLLGRRVLVVDLDPQANATDTLAPDEFDPDEDATLYDAFEDRERETDDLSKPGSALGCIIQSRWAHVDLLAGDIQLARLDAGRSKLCEKRLTRALQGLPTVSPVDGRPIFVLIDCPRALGPLTDAALTCAHAALIVTEATKTSLKGVRLVLDTVATVVEHYNPTLEIAGVLVNRYGRLARTKSRSIRSDQLRASLGDMVWDEVLPELPAVIGDVTESARVLPDPGDDNELTKNGGVLAARIIRRYAQRLLTVAQQGTN